jgi:hypothetical protein
MGFSGGKGNWKEPHGKKRYRMALRFIRRRRPCNSINLSSSIRTVQYIPVNELGKHKLIY